MHPPSLRYTRAPITAFKKKNQWLHQNRVCVERIVGGGGADTCGWRKRNLGQTWG